MRSIRPVLVVATALGLAGCAQSVPLALAPSATVTVHDLSTSAEHALQPGSPDHARLAAWLAANRSGWSTYVATPPADGTLVRARGLDLQVIGSTVLARTEDGVLSKSIEPADLGFLER